MLFGPGHILLPERPAIGMTQAICAKALPVPMLRKEANSNEYPETRLLALGLALLAITASAWARKYPLTAAQIVPAAGLH